MLYNIFWICFHSGLDIYASIIVPEKAKQTSFMKSIEKKDNNFISIFAENVLFQRLALQDAVVKLAFTWCRPCKAFLPRCGAVQGASVGGIDAGMECPCDEVECISWHVLGGERERESLVVQSWQPHKGDWRLASSGMERTDLSWFIYFYFNSND